MPHPAPARAAALAIALLAAGARPAAAQQYFSMTPGQIGAGACAGSTHGEGLGYAGGYPTDYFFGPGECDVHVGTTPTSASSVKPGIAPQVLIAHGAADWGTLKFYAEEHIQNWQNQGLYFPRSFAQVGFRDLVTIDDPAHHGQAGSFVADLHLTGTLYGHGDQGGARAVVTLYHGNLYDNLAVHGAGDDPAVHAFDELLHQQVSFVYGTPLDLGLFAYAVTSNRSEGGANGNPGDAVADFASTLQWLGISDVTAAGQPVAGFSVSSTSGSDWLVGPTATVPEPTTVTLLAGGLAALAAAARRRRATA